MMSRERPASARDRFRSNGRRSQGTKCRTRTTSPAHFALKIPAGSSAVAEGRSSRPTADPRPLPRGALQDALHRLRAVTSHGADRPKRRAVLAAHFAIEHQGGPWVDQRPKCSSNWPIQPEKPR
jgi:hypothetical protein